MRSDMGTPLKIFRPCLYGNLRPLPCAVRSACQFFQAAHFTNQTTLSTRTHLAMNLEVKERLGELDTPTKLYPRIISKYPTMTCRAFKEEFKELEATEVPSSSGQITLQGMPLLSLPALFVLRQPGRVSSIRIAGSKLVFLDIIQERHLVQSLCNFRILSETGVTTDEFKRFYQTVRRGDVLSEFAPVYENLLLNINALLTN